MAIENAKTLNVRIKNKYDSYENWAKSGLVLEAGEIAIAYTTVDVEVDNGTAKHPALLMKVGDGEKTFENLPWMSAKAADVLSVCKNEADLTEFVNNVIADAGIASDDAMEALADRVTVVEGDLNAETTGLKARMTTVEGKASANATAIEALQVLVGTEGVAAQIDAKISALNLANTYEAKGEAAKVQTALNEYKTSNDAAVQKNATDIAGEITRAKAAEEANANAIKAIKDGTTIDSFKDVEEALAGKEAAGAAADALVDAKAYADGLAKNYDAAGSATAAQTAAVNAAKEYADSLAKNYDEAGAADDALAAAKTYTDGFTGGKTVSESINAVIANYSTTEQMNSAIAKAKGEAVAHANGLDAAMDARVDVVEGKAHEHSFVESELNLIQDGDVAKWNAAEQNAKDYADGLDDAMDVRVKAVEAKLGTGEGGVDAQIAAAVAAEAKLREDADKELAADIKAITDDYLKAADKTELAGDIKDNADAIADLKELVSDTPVATQISTAVAAEAEIARAAEEALGERLEEVEAFFVTAEGEQLDTALDTLKEIQTYITGEGAAADQMVLDIAANKKAIEDHVATDHDFAAADATLKSELNTEIAKKADKTTVEGIDGRLTTAEGKITTLEGDLNTATTGLKAKMAAAEADIDALEEKVGETGVGAQIEAAIEALKIGDYAKAADLTAAINQHNTDKKDLEDAIALKANDADLKAIAKTGSTDDLVQGTMTLVFDCGSSAV